MRQTLGHWRFLFPSAALTVLGLGFSGCTVDFGSIPPGVYTGAPTCQLDVTGPTGETGQDTFTEDVTIAFGPLDAITINEVSVEIGAQHLRSLPTADLAFEIVDIRRTHRTLQISYEPRPSLPGIEVTGSLVESYRFQDNHLAASARAELTVNDADGTTTINIACNGNLPASEPTP